MEIELSKDIVYAMNKKSKKFFMNDEEFKATLEEGKDIYAVAAARFFKCSYEDCLEFKGGNPNLAGQYRRKMAKCILCAMYFSTKKKWRRFAFEIIEHLDFNGHKIEAIKD